MDGVTEQKVLEIIASQAGIEPAQVTREHRLREDLGMDSLDQMEVVMRLEEAFNIEIPDEAAESAGSVGQVIDFVVQQTAKPGSVQQ